MTKSYKFTHNETHSCNFYISCMPTTLLDKIFVEHTTIEIHKSMAIPLATTSRDFHALEGDIVTPALYPLMEITMYIYIGQVLVLSHSTPQPATVYMQSYKCL